MKDITHENRLEHSNKRWRPRVVKSNGGREMARFEEPGDGGRTIRVIDDGESRKAHVVAEDGTIQRILAPDEFSIE